MSCTVCGAPSSSDLKLSESAQSLLAKRQLRSTNESTLAPICLECRHLAGGFSTPSSSRVHPVVELQRLSNKGVGNRLSGVSEIISSLGGHNCDSFDSLICEILEGVDGHITLLTEMRMRSVLSLKHPLVSLTMEDPPTLIAKKSISAGTVLDVSSVPVLASKKRTHRNLDPTRPLSDHVIHSCHPNCQFVGFNPVERSVCHGDDHATYYASVLITTRPLFPGEPLSVDIENLPPYFKFAAVRIRGEELSRRGSIRKAFGLEIPIKMRPVSNLNCACVVCRGSNILTDAHSRITQAAPYPRVAITSFQRILEKEGVISVASDCTKTTVEELVTSNQIKYDFSRAFHCPLAPLCKDGVLYPSAHCVVTNASPPVQLDVWRCDSCLEWWPTKRDNVYRTAENSLLQSTIQFEEKAINLLKAAIGSLKMLHSGFVSLAEIEAINSREIADSDLAELRRRAVASLHFMEEMGSKSLTNKCYTTLKELLQACVDAGMVLEPTLHDAVFSNLSQTEGGVISARGRECHWVYGVACLYFSIYFLELGTNKLKGESEVEVTLDYSIRWMKLYLRCITPFSWGGKFIEKEDTTSLWARSKTMAGAACLKLASVIHCFPRQWTNSRQLFRFSELTNYVAVRTALDRFIKGTSGDVFSVDLAQFVQTHHEVTLLEVQAVGKLKAEFDRIQEGEADAKLGVFKWLHSDSSVEGVSSGGCAESHDDIIGDWEDYLVALSKDAVSRSQHPNLPPEVIAALRGLRGQN